MKNEFDPGTIDLEEISAARRPRAIGSYIFSGGFSLGVMEHFDVACHLEETNYGVATARRNFPNLPIYYGPEKWPLDELRKEPWDLIYGNPPCAAWSQAGAATKKGRDWRSSPLVACTERHFKLIEELHPVFWAWESVQQAWQRGEDFVRSLSLRASDLGYSTTILLHNAEYLGVPQRRRRFFMVCHRVAFDPRPPTFAPGVTLEEAIRGLNDPGEPLERNLGKVRWLLEHARQGENLSSTWMRCTPLDEQVVGERGQMIGRPPFTIKRARSGQPAPVVMHELIHPTEHRGLSIKELAILCGYPATYEFVGAKDAGQVGRGVCPPVGAYLAREVAWAIASGREEREPTLKLVDYTEPPGSVEQLEFSAASPTTATAVEGDTEEDPVTETIAETPPIAATARDVRPKPGLGSGAYIRLLLQMGRHSPDQIVELVHRHYPGSRASKGDVAWQRGYMKKHGQAVAAPAVVAAVAAPAVSPVADVEERRVPEEVRQGIDPDRQFDKSSLRANSHGRWQHRDYLAHFFRWTWAGRFVNSEVEVLDVGCGPDVPMIDALTMPRASVPKRYVGVDLNRQPRSTPSRLWATLRWEFNFLERHQELGKFDLVTNFEMIEHMARSDGVRLIAAMRDCLKKDGIILLSTPVFNGKAAKNHIFEWRVDELREAIEAAGLSVEARYGTFASQHDIKKVAAPAELALIKELAKFHSGEAMACFIAAKYPDASRNNVWQLRKK
jgi:DNA (cytosine-5)-methyltransferase 1